MDLHCRIFFKKPHHIGFIAFFYRASGDLAEEKELLDVLMMAVVVGKLYVYFGGRLIIPSVGKIKHFGRMLGDPLKNNLPPRKAIVPTSFVKRVMELFAEIRGYAPDLIGRMTSINSPYGKIWAEQVRIPICYSRTGKSQITLMACPSFEDFQINQIR